MSETLIKIALVVAAVVLALWAWSTFTEHLVAEGDAQGYARAQSEYRDRELRAVNAARAEEQRKTKQAQEVANDTRTKLDAAAAANRTAVAAGERLREQLAAFRGRAACTQPAAAGERAPADATADLYADVQRRLDEAAEGIARFADEAHIAGRGCERAYEVTQ